MLKSKCSSSASIFAFTAFTVGLLEITPQYSGMVRAKSSSADLTRQVDDVLFIVRNQRAQDQSIGDIIDQAQVSEGLTGDLPSASPVTSACTP